MSIYDDDVYLHTLWYDGIRLVQNIWKLLCVRIATQQYKMG